MDEMFDDALRQLLVDRCTPQTVRAIDGGEGPATLWAVLEESGFADALLPETDSGAGLPLADAHRLFALCGEFALPVPLAQTMLARAALAHAGVERPRGSIAIAHAAVHVPGALRCVAVPYGRVADWVLAGDGGAAWLLPAGAAHRDPGVFPLDANLEWTEDQVSAAPRAPGDLDLEAVQACALASQLAGALLNVFQRTLQYANERVQFGRPIGKFQAIQHQLSVMAEQVFAARMAAQIGCESRTATPVRARVAVAKARASEAALEVASLAHAIHGAIGFTEEFDLQLYTRRLHAWRQAAGSEGRWHDVLGELLVERHEGGAIDLVRAVTAPA